jgi:hypothetical protein
MPDHSARVHWNCSTVNASPWTSKKCSTCTIAKPPCCNVGGVVVEPEMARWT